MTYIKQIAAGYSQIPENKFKAQQLFHRLSIAIDLQFLKQYILHDSPV